MNAVFRGFNKPANATAPNEVVQHPLFQSVDPAVFPKLDVEAERLFGLENFGNTCYANSVVQALFFCEPFRRYVVNAYPETPIAQVLSVHDIKDNLKDAQNGSYNNNNARKSSPQGNPLHPMPATNGVSPHQTEVVPEADASQPSNTAAIPPLEFKPSTMLTTLRDLFVGMALHKDKTGVIAPEAFITQLRRENEFFRSSMHQDAHEFLNYLLNVIADEADRELKVKQKQLEEQQQQHDQEQQGDSQANNAAAADSSFERKRRSLMAKASNLSWVHQLFQGTLTNETLCLNCKNISSRDESFLDLSLDIEENSSITSCLRQFSASELLVNKNKFSCDVCGSLQDAERRMKIKHSPDVLSLHLKRFKWQEDAGKFTKLSYRVVFPFELRLFNTVDDSPDLDRLYHLWAIVVHIGSGPYHGHYVTIVKSMGRWLLFDDENITQISESDISNYFGDNQQLGCGYVLFYQAANIALPQVDSKISINGAASANSEDEAIEQLEHDHLAPLTSDAPSLQKSRTLVDGLSGGSSTKDRSRFLPRMRRSQTAKAASEADSYARPATAPEATIPSELASLSSSVDLSDSSSSSNMPNGPPKLVLDGLPPPPANLAFEQPPPSPSQPAERRGGLGRLFSRKSTRRKSNSGAVTPSAEQAPEGADLFQRYTQQQQQQQQRTTASDLPSLGYSNAAPSSATNTLAGDLSGGEGTDLSRSTASLGKKELKNQQKEQAKRDKEEAKQRAKREKEEAKRQKRESQLGRATTSSSDKS